MLSIDFLTSGLRSHSSGSMPPTRGALISFAIVSLLTFANRIGAEEQPAPPPSHRLLILDWNELSRAKRQAGSGDPSIVPALKRLRENGQRARISPSYSVTQKMLAPPGGSKNDYMSVAPYWWPNPKTPNGLPYVRRDGEINPERDHISDHKKLDGMIRAVTALAAGYFFTGNESYADHATEMLRIWFFNDATKMNPHLKYAQAVPGRTQGRGAGIIETHDLPDLLDAVALLSTSRAWTESDHRRLQSWFSGYLRWLLESPQGSEEALANNNHGSWYDVQIASYALFTGQERLARQVLSEFGPKRIATQIESDGRQPYELARSRAWHYAVFNLNALFKAALIAEKTGIDLWNFETNDRGIRRALEWLIPFASRERKWTYKETAAFEPHRLGPLLRIAAIRYYQPVYERAIVRLPKITGDETWRLLYPELAESK